MWGFLLNGQNKSRKIVKKSKSQKVTHPTVYFKNSFVTRSPRKKHLGVHLYEKLNFIHHIKEKISKANKGIGVIKKMKILFISLL